MPETPLAPAELRTGFVDTSAFPGRPAELAFPIASASGATDVRLILNWNSVAPAVREAGFDAANPADPAYRWDSFDRQVRLATASGLEPTVTVQGTPAWAEAWKGNARPGAGRPDLVELGLFARAAALRYNGRFADLPRVRYWQAWTEPNLDWFMMPQFDGKDAVSPEAYRRMVNQFAAAVKGVHSDNVVIAGGTSPFGAAGRAVAPLRFMRELLCMSKGRTSKPTCAARTRFDIWSHHPYTTGGPNRSARSPDDVSLGDLPEMRRLLDAAARAGRIRSRGPVRFWVTEFSWDTAPPDNTAVPALLHARWVAEALYRMWSAGVSLVSWFQLRDEPLATSHFQSGLYYHDGPEWKLNRPKPALTAFRFPFVALARNGAVLVWGRTPTSRAAAVVVESKSGRAWHRVRTLDSNRFGIFTTSLPVRPAGTFRARVGQEASLPFLIGKTRDIDLATPFGDPR